MSFFGKLFSGNKPTPPPAEPPKPVAPTRSAPPPRPFNDMQQQMQQQRQGPAYQSPQTQTETQSMDLFGGMSVKTGPSPPQQFQQPQPMGGLGMDMFK
jgi:hypothetical protein